MTTSYNCKNDLSQLVVNTSSKIPLTSNASDGFLIYVQVKKKNRITPVHCKYTGQLVV